MRTSLLGGLALDISKCYDRFFLEVMREVAVWDGVPREVYMPMLACYAHRQAGPAVPLVRGPAPRCPAAWHWRVLLSGPSARGGWGPLRLRGRSGGRVWRSGRGLASWAFGRDSGLRVSPDKCLCWATLAGDRAALVRSPGPPVKAH